MLLSPWVMCHDPRFFPDPEQFARDYKSRFSAYACFPFGGGAHVCTGQHLAMMEAEVLLAAMVEQYTFELISGQEIVPQALITTRPKNGLHLRVCIRL